MLRSLYSGVSGMRNFQTKLDVIGNNIANVNTTGFKGSRVMFQDAMSQTMAGATAPAATPADGRGGVNARQVGLGASMGSIDTNFQIGSPQTTGVPTDLYINGSGFFAVTPQVGGTTYLTRAGDLKFDTEGNLVNSQGMYVLGRDGGTTFDNVLKLEDNCTSYTIGQDGTIRQLLDDGTENNDLQIGLVVVSNPGGLEKIGNSLYQLSVNTQTWDGTNWVQSNGGVQIIAPTDSGAGVLNAGFLEMSNVELTAEFTEMIIAQRGFQANSRIITTSDEVLQEVVNLKR